MQITTKQYVKALQQEGVLNERRLKVLKAIYQSANQSACAAIIAQKTDIHIRQVNLVLGSLAKAVAEQLDVRLNTKAFPYYQWWPILCTGHRQRDGFYWELNPPLIEALESMQLV